VSVLSDEISTVNIN